MLSPVSLAIFGEWRWEVLVERQVTLGYVGRVIDWHAINLHPGVGLGSIGGHPNPNLGVYAAPKKQGMSQCGPGKAGRVAQPPQLRPYSDCLAHSFGLRNCVSLQLRVPITPQPPFDSQCKALAPGTLGHVQYGKYCNAGQHGQWFGSC